jgi:hypothetical protein
MQVSSESCCVEENIVHPSPRHIYYLSMKTLFPSIRSHHLFRAELAKQTYRAIMADLLTKLKRNYSIQKLVVNDKC